MHATVERIQHRVHGTDPPERRRQQRLLSNLLLATIVIAMVFVFATPFLNPALPPLQNPDFYLAITISGSLVITWLVNRLGWYRLAAWATTALFSGMVHATASFVFLGWNPHYHAADVNAFLLLAIPIFVAGLLLTRRELLIVSVVNLVGMVCVPLVFTHVSVWDLVAGPLIFNGLIAVFIMLVITHHQALERVRQQELREKEVWHRSLLETVFDGVAIVTSGDGRIIDANPGFCASVGTKTAVGTAFTDYIDPEGREEVREQLERGTGTPFEAQARTLSGESFPAEVVARAVPGPRGSVAIVALRDLTELKRTETELRTLEAQLIQQQKLEALGTLAAGVAHEINNPINVIMNYAQIIEDTLAADDPNRRFTTEIMHETDRVASIVRNLLSFARHEQPTRELATIPSIVEGTLSLVRTVLRKDGIELVLDITNDLPLIECHAQQIQQVIMNLIMNARDAVNARHQAPSEAGEKRITIRAAAARQNGAKFVRISVEDTGTGVSKSVLKRLFEPFFTTKSRTEGTGLGLAVTHGIVTDHGGRITVETEEGEYTRFHVDLPTFEGYEEEEAEGE